MNFHRYISKLMRVINGVALVFAIALVSGCDRGGKAQTSQADQAIYITNGDNITCRISDHDSSVVVKRIINETVLNRSTKFESHDISLPIVFAIRDEGSNNYFYKFIIVNPESGTDGVYMVYGSKIYETKSADFILLRTIWRRFCVK